MAINNIDNLQTTLNNSTKELTFIQILKSSNTKNVDISNNIKTFIDNSYNKTYEYLEIVNNAIYFNYKFTITLKNPLLIVYINSYKININTNDPYMELDTNYTIGDIGKYIQRRISFYGYNTVALLTNYVIYTTYELIFIQLTNNTVSKNLDIGNKITTFMDNSYNKTYEYLDITNEDIYKHCNPNGQLTFPLLLSYIQNYDTTLEYDKYININTITNIGTIIQNKLILPSSIPLLISYTNFTIYELTFIQLSYSTIIVNTDINNNIINYINNSYNKSYEYLSIINETIYKTYNNFGTNPILVLFIKPYYSNTITSSKYINITTTTNENSIKELIQKSLPIPTNTITKTQLNLYIKYSTYDLTLSKIKSSAITDIDISNNISEYINNKDIQFLDISNTTLYNDVSNNTSNPALLLFIKDYVPVSTTYVNPTQITTNSSSIFISNFVQSRLKQNIYDKNTLDKYAKYTNKELNFIQLTASGIQKNNDISNNINAYQKTYDYIDVSNTSLYNTYNRPLGNTEPLLLFFIKDYYTGISNETLGIFYTFGQYTIGTINKEYSIFFRDIIQDYLTNKQLGNSINSIITLNKYIYYRPYTSLYLQITNNNTLYTNINSVIDTYENQFFSTKNNYVYIDISNSDIYNNYNTETTFNILVLYKNSKYYYTILTENTNIFIITVLNNNFNFESILTISDLARNILPQDDITFIQVIKQNIAKNKNILNIINNININGKPKNYIDVSSSEIYNSYNLTNTNMPLLLINIKGLYNVITNLNSNSFIYITQTTNLTNIYDFIQGKLNTDITTMRQLQTYLKYTTYQITFIRLYKIRPIISDYYIKSLLINYNTNNIKYEYIQLSNLELIKFYKIYIKSLPSILLFKNINYTDDRFWEPCKFLSGENTVFPNINNSINNEYIQKSLGQLQIFLKYGLR